MEDNEMQDEGGLIDRIKESPRTVSALIIILIVAAAIYAFSGNEKQPIEKTGDQAAVTAEEGKDKAIEGGDQETSEETQENDANEPAGDTTKKEPKIAGTTIQPPVPDAPIEEPHRTDTSFVEVAQSGDGITHLARRATSKWLSENQVNYAVTDEHRIFIEDYIQNKIGTRGLALGESVEIDFNLIQEAVAAAGELNESQLQNLSQYTSALQ